MASFHSSSLREGEDALHLAELRLAVAVAAAAVVVAGPPPTPMTWMLSGRFLFSSSWLIVALKRSSWARSACSTCQTTLYFSLSFSASSGVYVGGDADRAG